MVPHTRFNPCGDFILKPTDAVGAKLYGLWKLSSPVFAVNRGVGEAGKLQDFRPSDNALHSASLGFDASGDTMQVQDVLGLGRKKLDYSSSF
jgi:hypothetical protein